MPAIPATNLGLLTCPEPGLTNGQCWDKYGLGPNGGVAPVGTIRLDGLENAVAWESSAPPPLGAPRSVLVRPTAMFPAEVRGGQVRLEFVLTGSDRSGMAIYQVDQSPAQVAEHGQGMLPDARQGVGPDTAGTHMVKTWRVDRRWRPIAGSELYFWYYVGEPTYGPLPPPD